ncbi:hypothetical protein UFOVP999_2 [uncultured Caudovirales phage]|uniref:Uncharacterized protein n=1 Tax=uncultured Caudovirales phage TaxID=2100421 RepID=A0A6J5PZK3_9CAUD|nr:hypothetical protein UFOVP999_2 [uncultured Caudovirales phage]
MIDEVSMNLSGYTLQQDRATYLSAAVTTTTSTSASPLILSLGSTENLGKGIIEIDEELLWVDSYDRVGGTATISPYGRGYLGTTAATHTADSKVTIAPTFPRFAVKRAINDTISAVGSSIFAADTTTITSNAAVAAFRLPTTGTTLNIRNILSIAYQSIGASKEWIPIRTWRFDGNANSTAFTSGQTISIYDVVPSGRTIQIVYAKDPTPFTTNADVFTTQTGLPESCKDLIILGATYRLLSNLDPARASMISPQADETDSKRPYGSSQSITKQIYALFNQRLTEEIKKQQDIYPIRIHYSL